MTLEHAETVDNPPKISAQSLALFGALFYEVKRPAEWWNTQSGPDLNEPNEEVSPWL